MRMPAVCTLTCAGYHVCPQYCHLSEWWAEGGGLGRWERAAKQEQQTRQRVLIFPMTQSDGKAYQR